MTALDRKARADLRADRLHELEGIIDRGLETFVEDGRALQEIRDNQLYHDTHKTFAEYVKERFGISRPHAYRLIDAAEVKLALSPIGDIRNEAHARELVPLYKKDPAAAAEVWREAGTDVSSSELGQRVWQHLNPTRDPGPVPRLIPRLEPVKPSNDRPRCNILDAYDLFTDACAKVPGDPEDFAAMLAWANSVKLALDDMIVKIDHHANGCSAAEARKAAP